MLGWLKKKKNKQSKQVIKQTSNNFLTKGQQHNHFNNKAARPAIAGLVVQ